MILQGKLEAGDQLAEAGLTVQVKVKRRSKKMGAAKRKRDLTARVKAIQAEAQGCWQIEIFNPLDAVGLHKKFLAGDDHAGRLLLLLGDALESAGKPPGMVCLLCDYEFSKERPPLSFVIVTAFRDDPTQAMANGLCPNCAKRDSLPTLITDKYRQAMIPDLRVLPTPHPPAKA